MRQRDVDEVWTQLDRGRLGSVLQEGPPALFASISGAHLYGFASANSDVDLRGAFVLPVRALLGLKPPEETITIERLEDNLELDWVAHDVRKFAAMMIRHNGYVLEQLYSPLSVAERPEAEELRALGKGCITRGLLRHYRGFARGRRKLLLEPTATVKHLLYAYRVYLTGIHVLTSGEIEANLPLLNETFRLSFVDELIARKRAGTEKEPLGEGEAAQHAAHLDKLELQLHEAYDRSSLPEEPTSVDALDDLVIRTRLAMDP